MFDAGYHVDRHSERGGTECTKGRQLQIVDIYANTNDCMSAARVRYRLFWGVNSSLARVSFRHVRQVDTE